MKSKARTLAEEYCRKHQDMPHLTLAKLLRKEHSLLFDSIEKTRSMIRQIRGLAGDRMRKGTTDTSLFIPKSPYFTLPKPAIVKRMPINIKGDKVLLLQDIHFPYHDIDRHSLDNSRFW